MGTTIINPYRFGIVAASAFKSVTGSGSDLTTYTFSGVDIGPASASRFVVVGVSYRA